MLLSKSESGLPRVRSGALSTSSGSPKLPNLDRAIAWAVSSLH